MLRTLDWSTPLFSDDDLVPISALQHFTFCKRQCALIHLERQWAENRLTAEGRILHEHAHEGEAEFRDGVLTARGLSLCSRRLGLGGVADVVEFHLLPGPPGASLSGRPGFWLPFAVEYKRGRPKPDRCDEIQLCAQALCLEEMLGVTLPRGALFYGQPRRRKEIEFSAALRSTTEEAATAVHRLLRERITPPPVDDARCRSCSLSDVCLPGPSSRKRVLAWVENEVKGKDRA